MKCYNCCKEIPADLEIGRQAVCPKCSSYLHCCLNCRFYDSTAHHECREPQADWVKEKEMGNFCDYFEPGQDGDSRGLSASEEAKRKLEQLFKKKDDD